MQLMSPGLGAMPQSATVRRPSFLARLWSRKWTILASVALIGGAAYVAPRVVYGPIVTVIEASRQDMVQSLVASGTVQAPNRVSISAQVTGAVADIPVAEGQAVKAGDVLVKLDDRDAQAQVRTAEAAVAQAEARLRQMDTSLVPTAESSLDQARAALVLAQKNFDRAAKLAAGGFATKSTIDDAKKALDVAQAQVRAAEVQVETNRQGGSDHLLNEALLAQAQSALESAKAKLAYYAITAPRDGTLLTRDVERGDTVQPGKALMTLSPAGATELVLEIDERNLALIQLGQKAIASADAFPNQSFDAVVSYINPAIDATRGSVEVKLTVPIPPPTLRQDMTVSVEIEVAKRSQALVVAPADLHDLRKAAPYVLVVEDGRVRKRPVKVGVIGIDKVEITEGVEPGALVIAGNGGGVGDGDRVRAARRATVPAL